MTALQLIPAEAIDDQEILDAIELAFGQRWGMDWYKWKHRDGPWGPSKGLVAVDHQGVVGVRLVLPWRMRFGQEEVTALRTVEAGTVPRAQGRGVFTALNGALMENLASDPTWTFLFSTPNHLSRPRYGKLGWTLMVEPVAHAYHLPLGKWARTEALSPESALTDFVPISSPQTRGLIATAWTPAALRWRTDSRTGNNYRASRLRNASGPNGLVYRILRRRRIRILSVTCAWGDRADLKSLIVGTAGREHVVFVLAPVGRGAAVGPWGPRLIRRGESVLAVWSTHDRESRHTWPIRETQAWSLTMADLESVI